ncbi:hypothetical protein BHM03_00049281 [Ensete ventricosum]|nr:hypothetical protein BHM03_00049281 [Ensete ventricosum]
MLEEEMEDREERSSGRFGKPPNRSMEAGPGERRLRHQPSRPGAPVVKRNPIGFVRRYRSTALLRWYVDTPRFRAVRIEPPGDVDGSAAVGTRVWRRRGDFLKCLLNERGKARFGLRLAT